ncbi:MAG TPA: hypothetical protein VIM99_04830, partial [Blastocatellia bacterium]
MDIAARLNGLFFPAFQWPMSDEPSDVFLSDLASGAITKNVVGEIASSDLLPAFDHRLAKAIRAETSRDLSASFITLRDRRRLPWKMG